MGRVESEFTNSLAMKISPLQYTISEYSFEITVTIVIVAVVIIVWAVRRWVYSYPLVGVTGLTNSAVPDEYCTSPPTLVEAGIDKKLSSRAQKANLENAPEHATRHWQIIVLGFI
jgi:hypothetical protein